MDDGARLFEWSNAVVAEEDPELRPSQAYIDAKIMEMVQFSFALRAAREANPGGDLISMLARAKIGGAPISPGVYIATFILLVVAGNETTRNSITGGLLAFHQYTEERAKVIADPSVLRSGAGEIVRWISPVHHMRRTAMADCMIGDQPIKRGDRVVMWYPAANRDPDAFLDPDRFNLARYQDPGAPRHLGFGTGQHVCVGQRLAELQIKVAFEELFAHLPRLAPVGQGRRVLSNFINGWKELPVDLGV
jgi:linalool 8-monooxygenase